MSSVLFFCTAVFWLNITHPGRMAYWAFRYDHKARQEANAFSRWSNCMLLCDRCMSQRPTKKSNPDMNYMNFRDDAPRLLTKISHSTYLETEPIVSAWVAMPGWHLYTCMHDMLHMVYLGFGRDLAGSLMADFLDHDVLGPGTLEEKLERFSLGMNAEFRKNKSLASNLFQSWAIRSTKECFNPDQSNHLISPFHFTIVQDCVVFEFIAPQGKFKQTMSKSLCGN